MTHTKNNQILFYCVCICQFLQRIWEVIITKPIYLTKKNTKYPKLKFRYEVIYLQSPVEEGKQRPQGCRLPESVRTFPLEKHVAFCLAAYYSHRYLKWALKNRRISHGLAHLALVRSYLSEKAMAPHSSTLAWKIPWKEEPGRPQSMGSLELDTTEQLHFQFSLSCIGEGNGNPLQCSCLENPRDRGAWWASVYGVAQSWTRLKRLNSSSRSCLYFPQFSDKDPEV